MEESPGAPHQLPQFPHEDQVPRVEHVDKPRSPAVPAGPRPEEHRARPQRGVPGGDGDGDDDDDGCDYDDAHLLERMLAESGPEVLELPRPPWPPT